MPRGSRHRSHRGHKHSSREARERSDSEDERDPKAERRRGSTPAASAEAEFEHAGRKRKERDMPEAGDRWNGEEEEKDRGEEQPYEEEKAAVAAGKSRSLGGRSSRRHEGESRGEEPRRRSEKEGERERRSTRDEREREREREREHGMDRERERDYMQERSKEYERKREKERRAADGEREQRHSARDRSSDGRREKSSYSSTVGGSYEDEYVVKGDYEAADRPRQDGIYDRGTEKDLRKEIKRDEFNEKDKWHVDGRKSDDRRVATMDDRSKSSYVSHYDEKYKDGGSREKFYDEFDRERRSRTDKYRGERSSRDHTSDRSESKYYKDSDKPIDSRSRSKIQDNDREVTPVTKEYNMKHADSRGRKRSPDDNTEYCDVRPRHAKEARSSVDRSALDNYKLELDDGGRVDAVEKYKLDYSDDRGRSGGVDNYKLESHDDGGRPESIHSNRVDVTPIRDHQKSSPVLTVHATKDEYRRSSKQAEPLRRSLSKERHHTSSASSGDPASVSGAAERMLDYQSVESGAKFKELAHSVDFVAGDVPAPTQCERTPTSDGNAPTMPNVDKSPSSSDRQNPNRKGTRRSLDVDEMGQRGSYQKEGRDHLTKEERGRDFSQGQLPNSEASRAGLLPHNRADQITRSSPGHLPPPPPARHGVNSPSVLRSGEDDSRGQAGDRKINNQYKRGDPSMGRGQGGSWNGVPSWPPPVANGFLPFQHGPSGGYLQVPQQFPPPLFGVRPFVDFNHGGVPLHMHEPPPDRFSGHGRPFGWRNPSDDSGPRHIQGWDGNSGIFGNDSHVYVRPEWEPNRHPVGERGWEVNGSPWKGQSAGTNLDKETDSSTRPSVDEPRTGQSLSVNECIMTENSEIKPPVESAGKGTPDSTRKMRDDSPKHLKSEDGGSDFCSTYLSKLDISHDLTCPDLYKQCINIVENEEREVGRRGIKCALDQDSNGSIKLVTGSLILTGKPMFPAIADDVFKKAMSLYKKNCGEPRAKKLLETIEPREGGDPPQAPDVENPKPMENVLPGAPDTDNLKKIDSPKVVEDDVKLVGNNAPKALEADESEAVDVVKGDSPPLSNSTGGDIMEDSGKIGSPGGVEAISAGDKECGGLMPECLSRIPNSPKSTH